MKRGDVLCLPAITGLIRLAALIVLSASAAQAQFADIRIDLAGNVVNTTPINYATGQLKINNVAVTTGGGAGTVQASGRVVAGTPS